MYIRTSRGVSIFNTISKYDFISIYFSVIMFIFCSNTISFQIDARNLFKYAAFLIKHQAFSYGCLGS